MCMSYSTKQYFDWEKQQKVSHDSKGKFPLRSMLFYSSTLSKDLIFNVFQKKLFQKIGNVKALLITVRPIHSSPVYKWFWRLAQWDCLGWMNEQRIWSRLFKGNNYPGIRKYLRFWARPAFRVITPRTIVVERKMKTCCFGKVPLLFFLWSMKVHCFIQTHSINFIPTQHEWGGECKRKFGTKRILISELLTI